eukprot:3057165-Prorocentrum_lima.AAC.1
MTAWLVTARQAESERDLDSGPGKRSRCRFASVDEGAFLESLAATRVFSEGEEARRVWQQAMDRP